MKIRLTNLVVKMLSIALTTSGLDTIFLHLTRKFDKIEIPCYTQQNKRQEIKSVLIDKNSRFLGIFDECCNYKTLQPLTYFSIMIADKPNFHFYYQCKICKRIFERTK